ncbi:hypothetical protein [Neisseria mucosa]|uniref:hypothetical protein n=1 Tax=Neisseria mucosa TaxID=488 RepID=UPI0009BE8CA8|nr:hypothetical protein [Neisseria mucosa]AVR80185.1 hypothetical protein NM96_13505 [Neisseria mucosa]
MWNATLQSEAPDHTYTPFQTTPCCVSQKGRLKPTVKPNKPTEAADTAPLPLHSTNRRTT